MDALYHLGKVLGKASGHQIRGLEESSECWSREADACPSEYRTPRNACNTPLSLREHVLHRWRAPNERMMVTQFEPTFNPTREATLGQLTIHLTTMKSDILEDSRGRKYCQSCFTVHSSCPHPASTIERPEADLTSSSRCRREQIHAEEDGRDSQSFS